LDHRERQGLSASRFCLSHRRLKTPCPTASKNISASC
jgi:hypothetical protein